MKISVTRLGARLAVIAGLTLVLGVTCGAVARAGTKVWNNTGGGPWTTAANWTPNGAPLAGDVIQFSSGGTFTVTAVPALSIQQLLVSNGSAVTLQAGGANTLTISGAAGTDLDVPSGTQLNVSGASVLSITLSAGATGSIGGAMTYSAAAHKLDAASAGAITFGSGAVFTQGTGCTSNVFNATGTANVIVFASGSSFIQLAGANPFGLAAPSSKVSFQTGSLFSFRQNSAPSFSNRTYANFEINSAAYTQTSTGGSPFTCDNFTMTAGSSHLQLTNVVIKGNLSVAPGATLDFNPLLAAAIGWSGTSAQTVSNGGTLTFNNLANVTVGNASGVTLQSAVTLPGTTTVNAGALLALAAPLTNSGTTIVSGALRIDSGGSVSAAPTYGGSSALIYNAAGGASVGAEWSGTGGTAGAGVPQDVTVEQGTVTMPAASRTVPGDLTFNGGGMALTSGDVTVGDVLALGASRITTGGNKVILPGAASLTRSGGGYIVGNLQRAVPAGASTPTFEVGDATDYTPAALSFGSGTVAGNLTVAVTAAAQPNLGSSAISPARYVKRYWRLTNGGVSGAFDATFQFLSGDVQGGADPAQFIAGRYDGGSWSYPTVGTKTSTSTQILGAGGFGDFAIGEVSRWIITASAGSNGAVDPAGAVSVVHGDSVVFTMTPATGYHLDSLYVDGAPVSPVSPYTFRNVTASHTLRATFAIDVFTIAASAGAHGAIDPSGSVAVDYGAGQGFTLSPAMGYHVDSLYVDGAPVTPVSPYTFTNVTADHTLRATFAIDVFTIAASAGAHGSIDPSGSVAVDYGAEQGFTIVPDMGYYVDSLYVDGASVGPVSPYVFANVTASHAIHAVFAAYDFIIVASAGPGGSIDPVGVVGVSDGADQAFTITPAIGHHVDSLYVDGVSVSPVSPYTFTGVAANHTLHATFAIDRFTLTATAGPHGSIAPPSASVAYGSGQAYTIAPDTGYHLDSLYVDGSPVPATLPFSLTNVQSDHAVHVTFAINVYTIAASASTHGAIDPSGSVQVTHGASQAFTLTADAGCHLDSLYVDGAPVDPVSPYTFTEVQAGHTIRVTFAVNPAVPAITLLTAAQQKTGNGGATTTGVHVSWPAVGAGATVELYRAGFGNYPEYDDGPLPGSVPPLPTAYPPAGRWALVGSVAAPGTSCDDQMPVRDYWYYVAFVTDRYGTRSPVSNLTKGALNYHLGDVVDPADSLLAGDDQVNAADVSRFGAHYGMSLAPGSHYNFLDIGPTADYSPNTLPTTDNVLDFEDLVVFALNYRRVSAPQMSLQPVAANRDELLLESVDRVVAGKDVQVSLRLSGTGAVQGLAMRLSWDPAVVAPAGYAAGALAESQGAMVLSARPGTVDAVVLGTGAGFRGEGVLATVSFHALRAGDPKIHLASADARDPQNGKVRLATSERAVRPLPAVTQLAPAMPNPFRQTATIAFSLAQGGPVELAVFSVDGRRVRTLVRESREPGEYRVTWDGRDDHGDPMSAGIYYAHLKAAQRGFTRTLTYLK